MHQRALLQASGTCPFLTPRMPDLRHNFGVELIRSSDETNQCKALDLVEMGGRSSRRTRSAQSWPLWVSEEGHLTVFGEITPSQEKASDAVDGALKQRVGANKPIISRARVLVAAR
eukprot:s1968_g13.t1